jgi:hypothetical protein
MFFPVVTLSALALRLHFLLPSELLGMFSLVLSSPADDLLPCDAEQWSFISTSSYNNNNNDRFCGLVFRIPGYRFRGAT